MKLLPIPLSPLGAPPLGMWNSEFLWRYPPAPPSPLVELKTQLPPQLSTDPRLWGREEVASFVRWTEREFDLPKFELDLFQMNGKAICLLTKSDLAERCPGAGDIIHNVLQLLIRDAQMLHRHLPSSPVTPTSRYPLSPHSHPPTPNWSSLAPPENPFYASPLQQFMASNSVTLSPAPSIDSQAGSPPQSQAEAAQNAYTQSSISANGRANNSSEAISSSDTGIGNSSGSSNQSDSDEDNHNKYEHKKLLPPPIHYQHHAMIHHQQQSPPLTPINKDAPSNLLLHHQQQMKLEYKGGNLFFNQNESSSPGGISNSSQSPSTPTTPGGFMPVKREFFPDTPEPNTSKFIWQYSFNSFLLTTLYFELQTADYCGTFCSNCWTTPNSGTATILPGNAVILECSRLSIQLALPSFGASRKTTCPWITIKCHARCGTTIVLTFCAKCRERDIATSKLFKIQIN